MSKNRNRTFKFDQNGLIIKNNVCCNKVEQRPPPSPPPSLLNLQENKYFGEHIPGDKRNYLSSAGSVDSVALSINNIETSSTSSASSVNSNWGPENQLKTEATRLIQDELEKMERIFCRLEPIPPHYDHAEYKEWMNFFPNLRILDTNLIESSDDDDDTIIDGNCDINKSNKTEEITPTRLRPSSKIDLTSKFKRKLGQVKVQMDDLNLDLDNYLKISPLKNYISYREETEAKINQRQKSSKLLTNREIGTTSKWMKDTDQFTFLPNFQENNNNRKSATIRTKRKSNLILPPIEISQFRSISATPRRLRQNSDDDDLPTSIRSSGRFLRWNIVEE